MKKLLLTSNGFYTEEIKQQFRKLLGDQLKMAKAVIITTASPKKEKNLFAIKAKDDLLALGLPEVDFLDIEWEDPLVLSDYDVIYLSGGNPFRLLFHLKESGTLDLMKQLSEKGIVIVGVSAGALVLGPHINLVSYFTPEMNDIQLVDLTALGLSEVIIFPHYDREDIFPDKDGRTIEERIQAFELKYNCNVHRLRDEEYLIIT